MKVLVSRDVDCPRELAFEYYSDRDADLEWWRGTRATRLTSNVRRAVGETNHQLQGFPGLPFTFETDIEVVEWDAPRRWREVSESGVCRYDVWYVVEEIDEKRSRVVLTGECIFKGWLRLLSPIARPILVRLTESNFDRLQAKLNALGATVS